jgi:prevent-host-death family protein
MEVNIHSAKTNLSRLILRAEAGEEIVIARAGKPAVRLTPVNPVVRSFFQPGALKGRLQVPEDFLDADAAADEEIERLFYLSPVMASEAGTSAASQTVENDRNVDVE